MNTQRSDSLKKANQTLANSSFCNYRKFLVALCEVHRGQPNYDRAHGFIRAQDFKGLLSFADDLVLQKYETADFHFSAHQLAALIRKYPFPQSAFQVDRKEAATVSFRRSEYRCKWMNRKFRLLDKMWSAENARFARMRSFIAYVLGEFSLNDIYSHCSYGPGVSIGVHGNETSLPRKMLAKEWTVSPGAYHYAKAALMSDPGHFELLANTANSPRTNRIVSWDPDVVSREFHNKVSFCEHNKISYVPKTAKTDRMIAVEPLLNGYLQMGVGTSLALRLKRIGVDLADQSRNQVLAREGSADDPDGWVTVDLSSASDSISTELVRYLLPPEWFDFMNCIRSKYYSLNGKQSRYEKFVSMGNGFCFPLESLLFAAMCDAACHESGVAPQFSVYGDDLLVRKPASTALLDILRSCGFTPNPKKTFISGPFRESCGADWYGKVDVRPVVCSKELDSVQSIFAFVNSVTYRKRNAFFGRSLDFLKSLVPPEWMFVRPYPGPANSAIEVDIDEFMSSPFARWNRKIHCWAWNELTDSSVPDKGASRHARYHLVLLQGALRGSSSEAPFTIRRKTRTTVTIVSHGGARSTWAPPTSVNVEDWVSHPFCLN